MDPTTGLVNRIRGDENTPCLTGPLFSLLSVEDRDDSWGTGSGAWRDDPRPFQVEKGSVRELYQGPVRRVVESVHRQGCNRAVVHTILYADLPWVEVRFRVLWTDPKRRLKLCVPTALDQGEILCEAPGGAIPRAWNGEEQVHGRWILVSKETHGKRAALGLVHSGQHGFDALNGEVRLSVLRSVPYCFFRGFDLEARERKYMDLGVHSFRLLALAGERQAVLERISSLADLLDAPPAALAHLPMGPAPESQEKAGEKPPPYFSPWAELLSLPTPGVRLAGITPGAQDKGNHRNIRITLHETTGKAGTARLLLRRGGFLLKIPLSPYQIRTIEVNDTGGWKEVPYGGAAIE